jgi:sugar phosphate isomerase/epimerase
MKSRRKFLKISAMTGAASLLKLDASSAGITNHHNELKLGVASYSLRKFTQEKAIAMAKRVGLEYMCFKSMHLPLSSSVKELQGGAKKVKDAGLVLYGAGVVYMTTREEVDQTFEYAKNAGMSIIVGVPAHDLLEYTNDKIRQYDIKVAIHNHGPGDDLYPSPGSIYQKIKGLDPRFGICMDIGHTRRIGQDPIEEGEKCFDRLFDIHLKDVDKAEADGESVEIGRGVIDIPGFLAMLVEKEYQGVVSLEYEKDADDPLPGLAESVGYVKGCLDSMDQ